MNFFLVTLCFVVSITFALQQENSLNPDDYLIDSLPGTNGTTIPFEMYGGYVNTSGGSMYFFFTECNGCDTSNTSVPVILWLNGGPGCSSLGGAFEELGPLRPNERGQLYFNPWAWNKFPAHVVFLESPPGVGFSVNNSAYQNDTLTAKYNYEFLQTFFQIFDNFANNPFYVAGESYGGHYVVQLADEIVSKQSEGDNSLNLKGFAVGNPLTDPETDLKYAPVAMAKGQGLGSLDLSLNHPNLAYDVKYLGDIDPYDLLANICTQENSPVRASLLDQCTGRKVFFPGHPLWPKDHPVTQKHFDKYFNHVLDDEEEENQVHSKRNLHWVPVCMDSYLQTYLNQKEVQEAMHADTNIFWTDCQNVGYDLSNVNISIIPVYEKLLTETDLRIVVYSGSSDFVIPFLGTEKWVLNNLTNVMTPYTQWNVFNGTSGEHTGQALGYHMYFENAQHSNYFAYSTIKGAGHMTPMWQPESSFQIIRTLLFDEPVSGV